MAYLLSPPPIIVAAALCPALAACGAETSPPLFDPGPGALDLNGVEFTGSEFVAYGFEVLRSADGRRWTRELRSDPGPERLAAGDGDGTFLGTTFIDDTTTEIWLSTDTRAWERVGEIDARIGRPVHGNGVWLNVSIPTRALLRSVDGRAWTTSDLEFGDPTRLAFVGGNFYLSGASPRVLVSGDGVSWSEITLPIDRDTLVFGPIEVAGEISFQAARVEDGERSDAVRLRERDGEWTSEPIDADRIIADPIRSGGAVLAGSAGDERLFRLVDAETWTWEAILASTNPFGPLAAGNGAVVASGYPMAVSVDDGATWSPGVELP